METTLPTVALSDTFDKYLPYIIEIRRRILLVLSVFFIFGALGFIYNAAILGFILNIFDLQGVNFVFTSPFQFLNLSVTCGVLAGTIAALPLFLFQVISFLKPALKAKEYRVLINVLPLSILLFVTGFAFGISIMKLTIVIFYQSAQNLNIGNYLDVSLLLSQVLTTALLLGLAFQFPIVLTILVRLGVIKHKVLNRYRPVAYVGGIVFAALMPPTDLLSMVLLAAPLIFLYETTIIANRYIFKSHLLET